MPCSCPVYTVSYLSVNCVLCCMLAHGIHPFISGVAVSTTSLLRYNFHLDLVFFVFSGAFLC